MAKRKKKDEKIFKEEMGDVKTKEVPENEVSVEDAVAEELESELVEPKSELETLQEQVAKFRDDNLRLMAEFDNFRKRTQKEKADLIRYGSEELFKALLPVVDNFGRSLEAMEKTDNLAAIKDGVSLVHKNMWQILERKGLNVIESKGEAFNSELHEAITSIPVEEEDQKGIVIDEVEPGYKLHDRVIRYSKVVVGE